MLNKTFAVTGSSSDLREIDFALRKKVRSKNPFKAIKKYDSVSISNSDQKRTLVCSLNGDTVKLSELLEKSNSEGIGRYVGQVEEFYKKNIGDYFPNIKTFESDNILSAIQKSVHTLKKLIK